MCAVQNFPLLPALPPPDSAWLLPDNIFEGCKNLEKIILPKDLKKIGESAFYGCEELREIEIAASVNSIGVAAFGGCNKINIRIDENNEIYSDDGNCIIHKPTLTVTHVNDNSSVPSYVKIIGKWRYPR